MEQKVMYLYEGTYQAGEGEEKNSTLISAIKIPRASRVELVRLIADDGKVLIKDGLDGYATAIDVDPSEASLWSEIDEPVEDEVA